MTLRHDTTDNVTAAVVLITLTKVEVWTALRDTDSGELNYSSPSFIHFLQQSHPSLSMSGGSGRQLYSFSVRSTIHSLTLRRMCHCSPN